MTGGAPPRTDRTAITLGVAGSMAGNVAWAWPQPVLVGVGVGMSLVLPVAVRLWRATPATQSGWRRWERVAVMSAICGGAALYSLVHISLLLHGLGAPWLIAPVPPAVMELLVVMAARASTPTAKPAPRASTPRKPASRPKVDGRSPSAVTPPAPATGGETPQERTRRLNRERQAARRARQRQETAA